MTRRVYFIKPIGMDGPVKIGCSRMPELRRKTLLTWSPFPLEIVAEIEGDFFLERRFHAKFLADHSHSEWFRVSNALLDTIAAVKAGTFDISTLPDGSKLKRTHLTPRKWTDAQKARAAMTRMVTRTEKETGRRALDHSVEGRAAFVADPIKHGIDREEDLRRRAKRSAEHYREVSASYLRMAEDREKLVA